MITTKMNKNLFVRSFGFMHIPFCYTELSLLMYTVVVCNWITNGMTESHRTIAQ